MRNIGFCVCLSFLAVLALSTSSKAQDDEWTGDVNISIGRRNLNPDNWKPVEGQTALGIDANFGKKEWPVRILLGASSSIGNGTVSDSGGSYDVEGKTTELSAGARVGRSYSGFTPYLAAGASWITAEVASNPNTSVKKSATDSFKPGYFITGGVTYRFQKIFNIGVAARYLGWTDVTLFGANGDADYIQYSLVIGWGW